MPIVLTKSVNAGALETWSLYFVARAGMKKAKVARGRKLAATLHARTGDAARIECWSMARRSLPTKPR